MAVETKEVTGWKWDTIELFNDSLAICDATFGFPKAGGQTQTSMLPTPNTDEDGGVIFYYVGDHVQLRPILGSTSTFDINVITD